MSSVYQRNREVSEYKFFTQAIAIRVEVNKLMASSSVVPKAYRLLNAVPTVETARSIVYNVNRADCFYPNTSFNALERKRYLTLAIADCEQLMLDMQCLMDIGLPVNANRFEALAGMVEEEIRLLKEGQPVKVEGMTSKAGKEFDATLQYSAERRGLEFIFPKNQIFNERSIGGVPLSPTQIKMLSEGHTILVEDMKFRNRNDTFSSFVTIDKVTGRPNYTRHNPETGEIYIPKEICNVQLTAEDKEVLRKGQAVYLENMIGRNGEEFSSFVKLDMNTGRTMYSRTPNGFNEQQAPRIPAEVYGHVFTAQEKANLQDGKTLLVEGLKNNGQTFSSYLKVNPYSGQLQYFQENPDIRRDTSRRAAQTETAQGQQQEQKKGASQAV